jgi:HK97 family phage major capsid protein
MARDITIELGGRRSTFRNLPMDLPGIQREIRKLSPRAGRLDPNEARFFHALTLRRLEIQRAAKRAAKRTTPKAAAPKATAPARAAGFTQAPVERTIDPTRATPIELRDGALKVIERNQHRLTSAQQDHLETLLRESTENRDAATVCKWTIMTENQHYRSAFWKTLRYETPTFTQMETFVLNRFREEFVSEMRAANEAGSFGLAIPATIDPSIVPSAQETAPIVVLSHAVTLTTNVYKGVASVGSSWAFSSEGSTYADETPTLAQPVVPIYTAKSFVPASIELSEDYPDWMAEITKTLARGYADLLSQKSAVGSGTGEPTGLFTALANTTTNPSHVVVTTTGHIGAVDVRAAWAAVPQRFRASATWVMHEDVLSQVRNDAGAASQVDIVVDRQGTMIMGRPVITSSYFPDFSGTSGSANYLVVGDLSGYTVASRLGLQVELCPQMRDVTGRPIGERGYLAYARLGMDATVPPALALLANS